MKAHRARVVAMQAIFQLEFQQRSVEDLLKFDWLDYRLPPEESQLAGKIIRGVAGQSERLDAIISKNSKNWDIDRISPVNKAVLRIAIYQLAEMPELAGKQVIDDAIKMARDYAEQDATRFINGVLDTIYRELQNSRKPAD